MTQIEREELVERYLAGEMSQIEESDFFLHVAVDNELQRTLRAFRIMDHAIQHDREVVVPERSRYRENIMTLLAATPVAGGAVGAGLAAGSSSTGAPMSGGSMSGASTSGVSSAGTSSVAATTSSTVSSSAGVAASTGAAATGAAATGIGASAGASAGVAGLFGAMGIGAWKIVMMVVVGGMLAAGTAMVISSGSSDSGKENAPAATAPAGMEAGPVTGSRPIDSLAADAVAGSAIDTVPAADPSVSDDSRGLHAPAASSDVELPRGSRTAKAPALRPRESDRQQTADKSDAKYPRQKNPVINLGTTTNAPPVSIQVEKPESKNK